MGEDRATGAKRPLFGVAPKGRLVILESGQMITIVTAGDRTAPTTDTERAKSFTSMLAYSGKYSIQNDQLTTHVDICSNEAWVGTEQSRAFRFEGSRLQLITAWGPNPFDPATVVRGISEWEREGYGAD